MAKVCVQCRKRFTPQYNSFQPTCSVECGIAFSKARPERIAEMKRKAAKQEKIEFNRKHKTPSKAAAPAQRVFNEWIRLRDSGKPCVSCGAADDGRTGRHASHYKPARTNPGLRFDENAVHASCDACNLFLSGNLVNYRIELVKRVGLAEVERIEGPQNLPRRTKDDFEAIRKEYAGRVKLIKHPWPEKVRRTGVR